MPPGQVKAEELDSGGRTGRLLSSLANVSVTVLDRNDNPPVFEKALYSASFMENAVRGTSILRVRRGATDAQNGCQPEMGAPSTSDTRQ